MSDQIVIVQDGVRQVVNLTGRAVTVTFLADNADGTFDRAYVAEWDERPVSHADEEHLADTHHPDALRHHLYVVHDHPGLDSLDPDYLAAEHRKAHTDGPRS